MASHPTHYDPTQHANPPVRLYLTIFVALLVLLFITVGLAFIPTGGHETLRDLLTTVGFLIAGAKAVLIILWFMHVKAGSRLTWVFASTAFVWLLIMFALSLNDYMTRDDEIPTHNGPHAQQAGTAGQPLEYRGDGTNFRR